MLPSGKLRVTQTAKIITISKKNQPEHLNPEDYC
jgi:hypothetical protein